MLRILLAEDNRGDVMLVQMALAQHQVAHEMHVVKDGEEAVQFIRKMGNSSSIPCPDVMLLDLNLPKLDGETVLSEFRKHPECEEAPVIVVSSSDAPSDLARMHALGISRYFRKPTEYEAFMELGAVVRDVVGKE
jgi:chemotaxis family two-component system response regulator Rcp1